MELKSVLAEWVHLDGVEAGAALVGAFRGSRCEFRVVSIGGLVLTRLAHCVRVVILVGSLGTRLAEGARVATEALVGVDHTSLAVTASREASCQVDLSGDTAINVVLASPFVALFGLGRRLVSVSELDNKTATGAATTASV